MLYWWSLAIIVDNHQRFLEMIKLIIDSSNIHCSWLLLMIINDHCWWSSIIIVDNHRLQYPRIDNCLMVTGPLVVKFTLVKYHQRLFRVYPETTSNPSLAWKKAVIFKINGDDDDDHRWLLWMCIDDNTRSNAWLAADHCFWTSFCLL